MAIRAEYEEEKRVFDLMKRLFFIVGTITAVVVFLILLVTSPTLISQTGAAGILVLIPVMLFGMVLTGFFAGVIPSGYIGMWRALKRSSFFVFGNPIVMLLILTFLAVVPVALSPIMYFCQWRKVSKLKCQLDTTA